MGKHNYSYLKQLPLFAGIDSSEDLDWVLNCVDGKERWYQPGDVIQKFGENVDFAGILLSGTAQTFILEENGELSVVETIGDGDLFGMEPPIGVKADEEIPQKASVGIRAVTECQVLPFRWLRLMHLCNFKCAFHQRLIDNVRKVLGNE